MICEEREGREGRNWREEGEVSIHSKGIMLHARVRPGLEAVLGEVSGAGRVSVLYSDEGVAVVCEGAESARVRLDIVNAVSAYTGFGSDRIKVLSMERSD